MEGQNDRREWNRLLLWALAALLAIGAGINGWAAVQLSDLDTRLSYVENRTMTFMDRADVLNRINDVSERVASGSSERKALTKQIDKIESKLDALLFSMGRIEKAIKDGGS